jgi:tripartite ATP-independent transporter DctP family solute receptor
MKPVLKLVTFSLAAALPLVLVSAGFAADIKDRNIKIGIGLTEDHPQGQSVKKFAEIVAAKSGGKMKVKLFAGGALGNDVTMVSALQGGTQEMTVPDTSTLVGQIKDFGVINFPFLFNNEAEADAVLDGPFGDKLLAKLPEKGLIGLAFWENGFRQTTNSKRPITKVKDYDGLKLRVMQNPLFIETFKTLGANAVPMAFTELFTAMETKTVDGQENPVPTIKASKFNEVQKYLTLTKHTYSVWVLMMSKKFWDTLTPDEQKLLKEAAIESRDYERKTIRAAGTQALSDLKTAGMKVNELPPAEVVKLREKAQPVIAKYTIEFGEPVSKELFSELQKVRAKGGKK